MGSQLSTDVKQHEYWLRFILALEVHVTKALLDVVHNRNNDPSYRGLPELPVDLYNYLNQNFRKCFLTLLQYKTLNQDQFDLLLPVNGHTDSSKWDITLTVVIIRNCVKIPQPIYGWNQVAAGDNSIAAGVIKARIFRNWMKHGKIDQVKTTTDFHVKWTEMNDVLICLHYNNIRKFKDLETDDVLEGYIEEAKKVFADLVTKEIDQAKKDVSQKVMVDIVGLKAKVVKNG